MKIVKMITEFFLYNHLNITNQNYKYKINFDYAFHLQPLKMLLH